MNKEDRITQIRHMLIRKLNLVKTVDKNNFLDFCNKLTSFLRQDRNNTLLSDNIETVENKINNFINFTNNIGLSDKEKVDILYNGFRLLDTVSEPDFLYKYILLSTIENSENSVRKRILKNEAKTLYKPFDELFARYSLIKKSGCDISKNLLATNSFNEFMKHFVCKGYIRKPHEILNVPISLEELIKQYPIDLEIIKEISNNELNKNVQIKRINSSFLTKLEKVELAIKNYKNVKNLKELSTLLGISTSSLQRYLTNDSKEIVSLEEYKRIKEWLNNAIINGNKEGGKTSQNLHGFKKDDEGHFKGSGKK